jgi:methylamine dehydrogenase light chain
MASRFDGLIEQMTRRVAAQTSRRSFLTRLGGLMLGSAMMPLLPVDRTIGVAHAADDSKLDPKSCDYWRYCGMDGFLCSCCGGSATSCPPGSELSPVTWVGTCRNPTDGKDYVLAYHDCCGKQSCGQCFCNRNEGDEPMYRPFANNDINWCLGAKSHMYHCTTSVIQGVAN